MYIATYMPSFKTFQKTFFIHYNQIVTEEGKIVSQFLTAKQRKKFPARKEHSYPAGNSTMENDDFA